MTADEKRAIYSDLAAQLAALLNGESDPIANAANTAALIYQGLPDPELGRLLYFARSPRDPSPGLPPPQPSPASGGGR